MPEQPPAAPRPEPVHGAHYYQVKVLAGFMDDAHVNSFLGDAVRTLDAHGKAQLDSNIVRARMAAQSAPHVSWSEVAHESIVDPHIDRLKNDREFRKAFAGRTYDFNYVNLEPLVAAQVYVRPPLADAPPATTSDDLLKLAFPTKWDTPADMAFTWPSGPLTFSGRHPCLQNKLHFSFEPHANRFVIGPPKTINIIQVVHYSGRYFLTNGYHRVYQCLAAGIKRLPAMVLLGKTAEHINTTGGTFSVRYLLDNARPPVMGDFVTDAAVDMPMRDKLYMTSVDLHVKSFILNI